MTDALRTAIRGVLAHPWLKFASVVLAAFTWLYVQGEEIEETRLIAEIAWELPRELLPTGALPANATLVLKGTRSAARKARAGRLKMVADVSRLPKGRHEVELDHFPVEGLPKTMERSGISPAVVELDLDEVAERRLPIRAVPVGKPAEGLILDGITIDPALALVRGPRQLVDGLVELATRPLDVNGLAVTTVRPIELDLRDGLVVATEGGFTARIAMSSRIEQRTIVDVPVWVRDAGYHVEPATISVAVEGPAPLLAGLELMARVILPNPAGKPRYEAWYGPRDGARVEVFNSAGDSIKVVSITPPSVVAATP